MQLAIRIPADLLARVDSFASDEFLTRSQAVRELLERGLVSGRVLTAPEARKRIADAIARALAP